MGFVWSYHAKEFLCGHELAYPLTHSLLIPMLGSMPCLHLCMCAGVVYLPSAYTYVLQCTSMKDYLVPMITRALCIFMKE